MPRYFHILLSILFFYTHPVLSQNSEEFFPNEKSIDLSLINKELECGIKHENQKKENSVDASPFTATLSAECEPLATVANCVNVISGSFFQVDRDLQGTTIDPLDFVRYYDSGSDAETYLGFGFGSGFPLWASDMERSRYNYGLINERDNFFLLYSTKGEGPSKEWGIDDKIFEKGYTNLCKAKISGKTNFANWKAVFRSKEGAKGWTVTLGDGAKRFYSKHVKMESGLRSRMNFPTEHAYLLEKEIKPNGNQLIYEYSSNPNKPRLKSIQTRNRRGTVVLNQLTFDYEKGMCTVKNNAGQCLTYHKKEEIRSILSTLGTRHRQGKFLENVVSSQKKGSLDYSLKDFTLKMAKIKKPGNQFLKIDYHSNGKVKALYGPQDTQEEALLFQFHYYKNLTEVKDALEQITAYTFDHQQRISDIRYLNQDKHTIRKDSFVWNLEKDKTGWLKSKSIGIGDQLCYLKTYQYDERGNVKEEKLYGNLTGKKEEFFKLSDKKSMDHSSITYHYSEDGFNLLTQKMTDEGLTVSYEYLKGTNLCTKMLQHYSGKIQERTFQTYDENGELHTLIEDNGSGEDENHLQDVTYRRIKTVECVKATGPSYGKPEIIKEFYRDKHTGKSVLLRKTTLSYDSQGCEREQEVVDSQGNRTISSKVYNQYLQLVKETNALGEVTEYEYDDNGNKISEELIGSGKKIDYSYDFSNRLIEKKEIHQHMGLIQITSYQYNAINQLISETDAYGQQTTYAYDRLGNQTHCIKPPLLDEKDAVIYPTVIKKYNLLNQPISVTDENGGVTTYTYNVYGDPTKIIYPDGSEEVCVYTPCGWLKAKRQANGTSINFDYDAKGHLLKKTFYDAQNNRLKAEEYHYEGSLLQSKKDSMGVITTFAYDGAGRKIKETLGNLKTIHYRYDDFDRLIERKEDVKVETYSYDAIGRLIEKTTKENGILTSKEKYHYDIQGNLKRKEVGHDQVAIYESHYGSDGNLEWKADPLGHRTLFSYDHHTPYALGNYVKTKTITDPLGRLTVETYDPFDRIAKREVFDNKQRISKTKWWYDPSGNCTKEHALVMANGRPIREYWVEKGYNKRGLIRKEVEMPQGKRTSYHYDAMNLLKQKIKPDGVAINYTYDALGRLKTIQSSDGGIHYTYDYDLHDNITKIKDHINHITQHRQFDLYNRLEKEDLSPEVAVAYAHDALGRVTKVTLTNGSSIRYVYRAHLNAIQRLEANDAVRYTIECPQYDLRGNLLESRSPAAVIRYTYDLLGRMVKIDSPQWSSHLEQFDAVGNLCSMQQRDPNGIINGQYSYDRLDHLTNELSHEHNQYAYDSLGNCLVKNEKPYQINSLNQITKSEEGEYAYDLNGNLKHESPVQAHYEYDALNRLTSCEKNGNRTTFIYDAFGRCLQITDASGTKKLIYQGNQEIGSLQNGKLQELRIVHPDERYDRTFATEIDGQTFFPIQDFRSNICALQKSDGNLAEWTRYSVFGSKTVKDIEGICNPWRFANRREVADLSLFTHRFYNSRLMRWQTTDPLGSLDSLNLYCYVHNNPFCYKDPDGRLAFTIPIIEFTFGVLISEVIWPTLGVLATGAVIYSADKLITHINNKVDDQEFANDEEEDKSIKKPPYCGEKLGKDPTKCPEEGFEWRGKGGPETGRGSWVKNLDLPNEIKLHPDFEHLPPKGPHWDYEGPGGKARLNTDGTWEWK